MSVTLAPDLVESPEEAALGERILYLSGTWWTSCSTFRLRATLRVGTDGALSGPIYWQALRVSNRPRSYFGTEVVQGQQRGKSLELQGVSVDPGLMQDHYKIELSGGDEAGTFGGVSRAYGNWGGRLEGQYSYKNRKG